MKKKEIIEFCKSILKKGDGYVLNNDEYNLMMDIFKLHPEFIQKYGCGVKSIFIKKTIYGTKCFYFKRFDGSETDISYLSCLKKRKLIDNVKTACRNALRPIIMDELSEINYGIDKCPVTGNLLEKGKVEVHHNGLCTFNWIFKVWYNSMITVNKIDFSTKMNVVSDNDVETVFIDDEIKDKFITFHYFHSDLLIVSKEGHRILHSKK